MINRKLNQIILALLVIGALVTFWTGETVRSFRERNAAAEARLEESSAAETKVEPAAGPSVNVRKRSSGKYEEFRRKFRETEETLDRLQSGRPGDERYVTRKNQAVPGSSRTGEENGTRKPLPLPESPQETRNRAPNIRACRRRPRRTGPMNCWSGIKTGYDPGQEILEKISRLCYSERQCFLLRSKQ